MPSLVTGARALAFACLLACTSGCGHAAVNAARGTWHEVRSPRFVLWTDGSPEKARALVEDLERFHQVLLTITTTEDRDVAPPVSIFLAKDTASFRGLSGTRNELMRGLFRAGNRGVYALVDASHPDGVRHALTGRIVLFHEYTHYVQALNGARMPSWYREGFAEYMAMTEFTDQEYTVGCPPLYRTEFAHQYKWLPMAQIFDAEPVASLMDAKSSPGSIVESYLQSWYAVHYFAGDPERQRKLQQYLREWAGGMPSDGAFKLAFGQTTAELNTVIKEHASQRTADCVALTPKQPLAVPAVSVRPLSAGEAHYHVGDLILNSFGPTDIAFTLLNEAEKQLAQDKKPMPELLVSLGIAHAQHALGKDGGGAAEIERARRYLQAAQQLAGTRADVLALEGDVLHAEALLLARGIDTDAVTPELVANTKAKLLAAREAYRKAIRADETFANAYYGLGATYLIDDNGSKEAEVVLEAAAYMLPLDANIAWTLGRIHVKRGNTLQAIAPLEYVLLWSENEELRTKATEELVKLRTAMAAPSSNDETPPTSAVTR